MKPIVLSNYHLARWAYAQRPKVNRRRPLAARLIKRLRRWFHAEN